MLLLFYSSSESNSYVKYYSFILCLFYSQEKYRNYDIRQFFAMYFIFVLENNCDWIYISIFDRNIIQISNHKNVMEMRLENQRSRYDTQ